MAFNNEISLEVNKKEIFQLFTNGNYISQLRESLPKVGITAERMIRVLFSSLAQNPKLAMCSKMSLFNCLIPSGRLSALFLTTKQQTPNTNFYAWPHQTGIQRPYQGPFGPSRPVRRALWVSS